MTREEALNLLPRFLNAITSMASVSETTVRKRLTYAVDQIEVFSISDIPEEIKEPYLKFLDLTSSKTVPKGLENHPKWALSQPVAYISPQRARKATDLLIGMVEKIVYAATSVD